MSMSAKRMFVSFPKSGRSWVRYALHRLGFADQILFHHDGFEYNDGARPPLDLDYARRLARYSDGNCIVYMHRDPRDVIVSLYHQVTGRFADFFHYDAALSDFIRDPYFGAENLQAFRMQWLDLCARGIALAVSYEECHVDFPGTLMKVLAHYGFEARREAILEASAAAAIDNMRDVERDGGFEEPWLRLRNGAPKVRRGTVGGYVDSLTDQDIAYLNRVFRLQPDHSRGTPK
jgi:Sulfotransferase domain